MESDGATATLSALRRSGSYLPFPFYQHLTYRNLSVCRKYYAFLSHHHCASAAIYS